jgi:hypothetical protein
MRNLVAITFLLLAFLIQSCKGQSVPRFQYEKARDFLTKTEKESEKPTLKAHLKEGDLIFLYHNWKVDTMGASLLRKGNGLIIMAELLSGAA